MKQNPIDIIELFNKFGEWLKYDKSQKSFTLSSYDFHRCGESIEMIQNKLDPTGSLSCLFAKSFFMRSLKNTKLSVYDVLSNTYDLDNVKNLYNMFYDTAVSSVEEGLDEKILQICTTHLKEISTALPDFQEISTRTRISDIVYYALEKFEYMNIEVLKYPQHDYAPCDKYYIDIETYDTLGECLLNSIKSQISQSVKLVYITNHNTNDGYFSYILKSGEGIISINDRIDESFRGQHSSGRNQRYTDGYNYACFPYEILDFSEDRDYKGYSTGKTINLDNLSDKMSDIDFLYKHILKLVCMSNVPLCIPQESQMVFCSSLLPYNIKQSMDICDNDTQMISLMDSSMLPVEYYQEFSIDSNHATWQKDTLDIMAEYGRLLSVKDVDSPKSHRTFGYFEPSIDNTSILQEFASEGTQFNGNISDYINTKLLKDETSVIHPEVVGSPRYLDVISYHEARKQLANDVKENMFRQFYESGFNCTKWFRNQFEYCNEHETRLKLMQLLVHYDADTSGMKIHMESEQLWKPCWSPYQQGGYHEKYQDSDTGTACNVWLTCTVESEEGFRRLFGDIKLPKFIKGYTDKQRDVSGNSLLNAHDSCASIGNINERRMKRLYIDWVEKNIGYIESSRAYDAIGNFKFCIGMSKRTYNKLLKIVNTFIENKQIMKED